jgi:hypothetical protein
LPHDSSSCNRAHFRRPHVSQGSRARLERRTGGAHIVDQYDDLAAQRLRRARRHEGVPYVLVAPRGWKARLRGGRPRSTERAEDRKAQLSGEVGGLIESASTAPLPMKRYGYRVGGARQDIGAPHAHQGAEGHGQRSAAVVFQRVDDGAKRAVVGADGARAADDGLAAPASGAWL